MILPDAEIKIFMTASPECRARRRYEELIAKGQRTTYEAVLEEMNQRDYQDSTRTVAPAEAAADAVLLDNTGMTLEENVEAVITLVRRYAESEARI